jgi:hypothetical protein
MTNPSKLAEILWQIDTGASNESVEEAEAAILAWIDEAIGPDDEMEHSTGKTELSRIMSVQAFYQNKLRAEIRHNLGIKPSTGHDLPTEDLKPPQGQEEAQ